MIQKTWKRGQKQTYTDRPLTEEEKIFASDLENYNRLFMFMKHNGLNEEEWYDILIIPYLQAVKKYCSREELHIYPFWSILTRVLSCAYHHHFRSMNAKRNMPIGGIVSLDATLQRDNSFAEFQIGEMWIDQKQQVERVVLDKEMLAEILFSLNSIQQEIFKMLLEGYSKKEIGTVLCITYSSLKTQLAKVEKVVLAYFAN